MNMSSRLFGCFPLNRSSLPDVLFGCQFVDCDGCQPRRPWPLSRPCNGPTCSHCYGDYGLCTLRASVKKSCIRRRTRAIRRKIDCTLHSLTTYVHTHWRSLWSDQGCSSGASMWGERRPHFFPGNRRINNVPDILVHFFVAGVHFF